MIVATELTSMMLSNVTRTARNRRTVTLPGSAEKEEDCINVVSGENIQSNKMGYFDQSTFCQEGQSVLP